MNQVLDKRRVRASFAAAAAGYDAAAGLQRQAGGYLLDLAPPMAAPLLDLGCGTGYIAGLLRNRRPGAEIWAADLAAPMLAACRDKLPDLRGYVCADAERLPFAANSFAHVYANLVLQWCQDLPAALAECRRVLRPGGRLAFATFGPKTLIELKQAWAAVDAEPHVNEFYALPQVADFLNVAGFSLLHAESRLEQPVYADVLALMRELKQIGAHNAHVGRRRQTTSRGQLRRMTDAYRELLAGGPLIASYEIIYAVAA